jgi:glyoxylase-like metal-dependent hydrolase (beta-lactamase superfamily II)
VADRLLVVPTPGHSPGHQSLLVDGTTDGTVLLAGQAFDSASELASAVLARQLGTDVHDSTAPGWVDELADLDVDVALFAHDLAQWRPPVASFVGSRPRDPWPS